METKDIITSVDRQKVEAVLEQFRPLPPEVLRIEAQYEPDSSGDPAVYLRFIVRDDIPLHRDDVNRLSAFASRVLDGLYDANIGGYAYSRLHQAA